MRRRGLKPMGLVVALIAIAITTWMQRGESTRTNAPAPPQQQQQQQQREARQYNLEQVPEAERAQLRETLRLIDAGGPFPHPKKDGTTFGNREGRLPNQPRGYYREYTVPTPGAKNRGARRVVQGKGGETYYTNDHYQSFVRLDL